MLRYLILIPLLLLSTYAFSEAKINALSTDKRAKVVWFQPNQIYPIDTSYLISTDVIFSSQEEVQYFYGGDTSAWEINYNGNHLYIKAKKLDASGNLNVHTNKFDYHFLLTVRSLNKDSADQALLVQFTYPKSLLNDDRLTTQPIKLPKNLCKDSQQFNLHYSYTGSREQAPLMACDDGAFTYFKFNKHIELPAIFAVLPDRSEQVVNYRVENGFVVIERVAKAYTLRNGETVTSIYNDQDINHWNSAH